jgi:N-formylglutamate amidohydrolase
MMPDYFTLIRPREKRLPIIISSPHSGVEIPDDIKKHMHPELAASMPDTDWFVHELYDFAEDLGITLIRAKYSRFVVDLNRDPDGQALYHDGRKETGIVPLFTFGGDPIYREDHVPTAAEIRERIATYYQPYHQAVLGEVKSLRAEFRNVLFFDAHSIARQVLTIRKDPFPDLMLGDQRGVTAAKTLSLSALKALKNSDAGFDVTHNEPFMGGYLTRHFGKPASGCHALQLEMSQDIYLTNDRLRVDPSKKMRLVPVLENLFHGILEELHKL